MENTKMISTDEKKKVAYALNLCAVSISQIIDSKDIIVLKQEREAILSNLNLQNFVKHPALLEIIKQILDTITYIEIQAGDMSLIEKQYQEKLKNAIWQAIPSPGVLFAGGEPISIAISLVAQVGTGYMNYRRNKSQYNIDKDQSEWELKRYEMEQLYGLRSQLFETAWKLSSDYDFDDKLRLSQKQLARFSEALLESDPLKRFERLDVMSEKFNAFPPFWYYKGNAAMEVFRNLSKVKFAEEYKQKAIDSYDQFQKYYFEFLREDILAASCCIEHISLLGPNDVRIPTLLDKALKYAGENYDLLQQSIFVNISLGRIENVILPLREMIANNYNVGLNGLILSRIYLTMSNKNEYDKLAAIAGPNNVLPWSKNSDDAEILILQKNILEISKAYSEMANELSIKLIIVKKTENMNQLYNLFKEISTIILKYTADSETLKLKLDNAESKLKNAIIKPDKDLIKEFFDASNQVAVEINNSDFSSQIIEDGATIINNMKIISNITTKKK